MFIIIEEAFVTEEKTVLDAVTSHAGVLGFQSYIHFHFWLPVTVHPRRQQIMIQQVGSLASTYGVVPEFLVTSVDLVQPPL